MMFARGWREVPEGLRSSPEFGQNFDTKGERLR
jgi:hypothetical protein